MSKLNLPPFYVGQKVVALVSGCGITKGHIYTVQRCFKGCHTWFVELNVPVISNVSDHMVCRHCDGPLPFPIINGKPIFPEHLCFSPAEENFEQITMKEVIEIEIPLIGVN